MNRKALLRACAELQSKSWKLVDMQGVKVPAKLLNSFLFIFFSLPGAFYITWQKFSLFFSCPFSVQSQSLRFERHTVLRLGSAGVYDQ